MIEFICLNMRSVDDPLELNYRFNKDLVSDLELSLGHGIVSKVGA